MTEQELVLKQRALNIIEHVEPDDAFVIEDNFQALLTDWHQAVSQDEGRFISGADVATFAGAVVPFLLIFLGDVAKDLAKDRAKEAAAKMLDKLLRREADAEEAARLQSEIESTIAASKFSTDQKKVLCDGFEVLFRSMKSSR